MSLCVSFKTLRAENCLPGSDYVHGGCSQSYNYERFIAASLERHTFIVAKKSDTTREGDKRHTNGKSTRHAGGDSCSKLRFSFAREKMFNCGFCHILSIHITSSSPVPFISK